MYIYDSRWDDCGNRHAQLGTLAGYPGNQIVYGQEWLIL